MCNPHIVVMLWRVRTGDFDYELPPELVAQVPAPRRESSRLLVLDRRSGAVTHKHFFNLPELLRSGDVLVLNNSRVIPARLRGTNAKSGGRFEILLLEQNALNDWWVMLRPGKRAKIGTEIQLENASQPGNVLAKVMDIDDEGHRRLIFSNTPDVLRTAEDIGEVPLPPYIIRQGAVPGDEDRARYQTVYAEPAGSVAAPTAGLHFSKQLLEQIRKQGVTLSFITLHVGLGTFAPVKAETIASHRMHEERFEVTPQAAQDVNAAKAEGRRVIAVGTTTVRVLESVAQNHAGKLVPGPGRTRIFVYPPHEFRIVDALLTNFHLPRSTLLMLVSAFAAPGQVSGRDTALRAYREAIRERYRFFSYGDAMFLQ